ncbi:hypothetical protein [Arthrobacter sp. H5]|uniref:hypothetical protein n=1 Tax=Arthrobacter sp. H5 TaxID=1267973 RepID=UPI00048293A5|nr:hypothetical protein [Arthrobacter sp. H5]
MSEQSKDEGREVNPNEGGGSTSDENWHGDAGDQANDLRFAEEQQLINSQAHGEFPDGSVDETVTGGYTGAQTPTSDGGYTSAENSVEEGEYTDVEGDATGVTEREGQYTDADSSDDPDRDKGTR